MSFCSVVDRSPRTIHVTQPLRDCVLWGWGLYMQRQDLRPLYCKNPVQQSLTATRASRAYLAPSSVNYPFLLKLLACGKQWSLTCMSRQLQLLASNKTDDWAKTLIQCSQWESKATTCRAHLHAPAKAQADRGYETELENDRKWRKSH